MNSEYWFEKIVKKLERRFKGYAIENLTSYIVGLNGFVFLLYYFNPKYIYYLTLNMDKVMEGEIWRLFTYLFIPPLTNVIFVVFALYFLYMVGSALETEWGSFRFNLYYFIGMIGTTVIAVMLPSTFVTNTYLITSLFLAFATLNPDFTILLFFIIPVKMKYLGMFTWAVIILGFLFGDINSKMVALAGIMNYLLFFGPDIILNVKHMHRRTKYQAVVEATEAKNIHKCEICGKTEQDDPELLFRVCTKCEAGKEYCMAHAKDHEHK